MITKNGLFARLAFMFKDLPTEQLQDLANAALADERQAGVDGAVDGAIYKANVGKSLAEMAKAGKFAETPQDADPRTFDMFNRRDGGTGTERLGPIGQAEQASGAGTDMVARFSELAEQHDALTRAYNAMGERLSGVEAAVKSIASFIAKAVDGSFPADATGHNGSSAPAKEKEEDKEDALDKAARTGEIPVLSIGGFLNQLANRSRFSPVPPQFVKADLPAAVDEDAGGMDRDDAIKAAVLRNRMLLANTLPHGSAGQVAAERGAKELAQRYLPPFLLQQSGSVRMN